MFPDWSEEKISRHASSKSKMFGQSIMQSFRMHLGQTSDSKLENADEWLFGRHHGLFSPILDWTRSPYIAAFFAAADVVMNASTKSPGHFAIWSLSTLLFEEHSQAHASTDKFRTLEIFDAAKLGNPRGIAQQGAGTFVYPDTDFVNLASEVDTQPLAKESLRCFLIPNSEAESAIDHLYLMNIHFRSLYPDPIGLAMQANMNLHHYGYEGLVGAAGYEDLLPDENR